MDGVVSHAEGTRIDEATEADDESADHRPPHPIQVTGQLFEQVFGSIDGLGHQPGGESAGDTDGYRPEQDHAAELAVRGNGEDRLRRDEAGASHHHAQRVGGCCRDPDEDHRAGLEFERQQLDAEQGGGDWGSEHRAHPGCCSGDQ